MNANLAETKDAADFVIEISNHRLGKFLEATDKIFFPAVVSLDYQVKLSILDKILIPSMRYQSLPPKIFPMILRVFFQMKSKQIRLNRISLARR